jgi:hypothetical protein
MKNKARLTKLLVNPIVLLTMGTLVVLACYDAAEPDPNDTTSITWGQECKFEGVPPTQDCKGTCGGTYREQSSRCVVKPTWTGQFCSAGEAKVKMKGFTGTCKVVTIDGNDVCYCSDKKDLPGTEVEVKIVKCTCVSCFGGG